MDKKSFMKIMTKVYTILGFTLIIAAVVIIAIPTAPYIAYRLFPGQTENDVEIISKGVTEEGKINLEVVDVDLPDKDEDLPVDPVLIIPSINVHSPISMDKDYEEVLKKGSWIVPGYGTPENGKKPIIIAAHRFGYAYWDGTTRNKISFYNLPSTEVGDEIAIVWDQREYVYRINKTEESTLITDYSHDLILYTCKYFSSPTRIFRYADRLE